MWIVLTLCSVLVELAVSYLTLLLTSNYGEQLALIYLCLRLHIRQYKLQKAEYRAAETMAI